MIDNGILLKLFKYWRSKMVSGCVPSRADIEPRELRDLLPFIFLAGVRPAGEYGPEIAMRLTGTHVERMIAFDPTGCAVSKSGRTCWKDFTICQDFFDAAAKRLVIFATHEMRIAPAGKQPGAMLRYDRLLLPLSVDGVRINMLLGGLVATVSKNPRLLWQNVYDFEEIGNWRIADPFEWPIELPL